STYGVWWIRQSMQRAIATEGRAVRLPLNVVAREQRLSREARRLEAELGRRATEHELAKATGLTSRQIEQTLAAAHVTASLNQAVGQDDDGELADLLEDTQAPEAFEQTSASLAAEEVRAALRALPERERLVLELRFGLDGEERTLAGVASELDLTRTRVRDRDARRRAPRLRGVADDAASPPVHGSRSSDRQVDPADAHARTARSGDPLHDRQPRQPAVRPSDLDACNASHSSERSR